MRHATRAGAAALAFLCGVAFAAAQTTSPAPPAASPTTPGAMQGQIKPTDDQSDALIKVFENLVVQAIPGLQQPTVGTSAPPDLKLQPMPPQGAAVLPQAKDHHVAKTDDDTIVIVDPVTRQIVGVITDDDDDDDEGRAVAPSDKK